MRDRSMNVTSVILQTARRAHWLSMGIVITVIAAIVMALLPPLILARIVDALTNQESVQVAAILLYYGTIALTGIVESLREGLLTIFGQRITHTLRGLMADKFRRLTIGEISGNEAGQVVSRFVGDVDTIENLFTSGIVSMFADACRIVSIMVVIWTHNPGLSIVLLVLLPLIYWFTRYVQRSTHAAQLENRRAISRVSGHVPETLRNIRTIHCLQKEDYMERRYDEYIEESYQAVERTNYYDAIYSPVIYILRDAVVASVMVLSASGDSRILALFGMTAGTAVAVISYISQIFEPVESLGMEIQTIQSAIAGVSRVNEFLALPEYHVPEDVSLERALQMTAALRDSACSHAAAEQEGAAPIEILNVTFGYDERKVLEHFNMRIRAGEQVTLAGRTGAGKSTILRLLLGLYEPQEGHVRIHGMDAGGIPPHLRRHLIGYVEQSFHMVPGTVRDQITLYDGSIKADQITNAARLVGLHDTIMGLADGYDTPCTAEILSQGQWQLLSIARAIVAEPGILLLDEITANLDADTEMMVLTALREVSRDRTVLSISHRTAAMADARIVTVGA